MQVLQDVRLLMRCLLFISILSMDLGKCQVSFVCRLMKETRHLGKGLIIRYYELHNNFKFLTGRFFWCRYSLIRQQFGPPNKAEISILDYQSQQQKLMPMLCSAYAFHFASEYLVSDSSLSES